MRLLTTLTFLLISSLSYGQGIWNQVNGNSKFWRLKADSVLIEPRDTNSTNNAFYLGAPVGDSGRKAYYHGRFWGHDSTKFRSFAFLDDILINVDSLNARYASVPIVDSLRAKNGNITPHVILEGYYAINDGGGGIFIWIDTSTAADNGGTIFAVQGIVTGRWHRQYSNGINIRWFGAVGDSATDCTAAIQAAINALPVFGGQIDIPAGRYLTTGNIIVDRLVTFIGQGGPLATSQIPPPYIWFPNQSAIFNSSPTNTTFIVNAGACQFKNFAIISNSSTTPSGEGIRFNQGSCARIEAMGVKGFYNNINFQNGGRWVMEGTQLWGAVNVNLVIRFQTAPDGGDQAISNSTFNTGPHANMTHIEYISGGGLKLVNNKFNMGGGLETKARRCLYLSNTDGPTVDLLIANNSFENFTECAIDLSPQYGFSGILITGNQFNPNPTCDTLIKISNGNAGYVSLVGNLFENATVGVLSRSGSTLMGVNNFQNVTTPYYGTVQRDPFWVSVNARYTDTLRSNKGFFLPTSYAEEPTRLWQSNGSGILDFGAHSATTARYGVRIRVPDNTGNLHFQTAPATTGGTLTFTDVMQLGNTGNLTIGGAGGASTLTVIGSQSNSIAFTSGNLTLGASHSTILISNAAHVITFPSASSCPGRQYHLVNYNTGGNVTISSINKDGAATTALPSNAKWTVQSNGTNWYVIQD